MKRSGLAFLLPLTLLAAVRPAAGAETATVSAAAAFDQLKALAGEWAGMAVEEQSFPVTVQYRVTGNGSAVVETQFPGTPHEMVTVYYRDGNDLVLTHYCAAGNQPRMKLDAAASKPDELRFAFTGGSNLDPAKDMHMHEVRIALLSGDKIESDWTAYQNGQKAHTAHFQLTRKAK